MIAGLCTLIIVLLACIISFTFVLGIDIRNQDPYKILRVLTLTTRWFYLTIELDRFAYDTPLLRIELYKSRGRAFGFKFWHWIIRSSDTFWANF